MVRVVLLVIAILAGLLPVRSMAQGKAPAAQYPPDKSEKGAFAVDAGGRPLRALEAGSTLHVGARGLRPHTTYEFRLALDRERIPSLAEAISFARVTTDARGDVPAFVLWYESGVVGCAKPLAEGVPPRPNSYRT